MFPWLQIAAMLQKEPELRPSADAIYGDMLPPLLRKFSREEDPAIFSDDDQESDNTTPTKSVTAVYMMQWAVDEHVLRTVTCSITVFFLRVVVIAWAWLVQSFITGGMGLNAPLPGPFEGTQTLNLKILHLFRPSNFSSPSYIHLSLNVIIIDIQTSVVLVRSLHYSYGLVTVCKSISIIVIFLVSELNHFSAY